jgi:serine protease Do
MPLISSVCRASVLVGGWLLALTVTGAPAAAQARSSQAARPPVTLADMSDAFETLAARVSPSVVSVIATGYGEIRQTAETTGGLITRQRAGGSGVILDSSGLVVTNAHVVAGATRVQVVIPPPEPPPGEKRSIVRPRGELVDAKVIGLDLETDLAVLRVNRSNLHALELGDSDSLRQGAIVLAFGNPLGLEDSVSMGVVSAVGRQRAPDDPMVYVQTDAPINPGNSGGPLVDTAGRVVGINTFIVTRSGGSQGLGFAVPSNIVRTIYEQIRQTGRVRRGSVGVSVQTITPALAAGLQLERLQGVVVGDVYPGGPGDVAGLQPGDVVLTLDGKPMENGRQFEVNVYQRRVGDTIAIEFMRGQERKRTTAAVAERQSAPAVFADMADPADNLVPRLGVLAIPLDAKVSSMLPQLRREGGLLVAAKSADAPPSDQGLEIGDVVYGLNGTPVTGLDQFKAAVARIPAGAPCVLQVQRGGRLMFVALEID